MMRAFISLFIILNTVFPFIAGETGCPPPEDIQPCSCIRHPAPRLICKNILRTDDILRIFRFSERYTYQEVHIIDSAFPYIPVEIFQKTFVKELYVQSSSLSSLLDGPVYGTKHPFKMSIEGTRVMNAFTSTNLSSFSMLNELIVNSSPVQHIPIKYSYSLPKGLKQLSFSGNGMKKIGSGALNNLPNLEKFSVENNKLTYLTRDIFPKPFNVRILNFDFNRIDSIPNDMFQSMPNLNFLSMKNNLISSIPESAFYGRLRNIPFFRFDENPLECDCKILWVIKDKPEVLGGKCTYPVKFNGRKLQDLKPAEFSCYN